VSDAFSIHVQTGLIFLESYQVTEESKLGNAAMLDLHISKTVESGLVTAGKHSERIKEAKRRLNPELFLEGHVEGRGGDLAGLGRSEGNGRGNKGSKDGNLHLEIFSSLSENMRKIDYIFISREGLLSDKFQNGEDTETAKL